MTDLRMVSLATNHLEFRDKIKGVNEEDFPTLGGGPGEAFPSLGGGPKQPKEDFPSLGGGSKQSSKSPKKPREEAKSGVGELEKEMFKNNELVIRHKLNPNKQNNKNKK